MGTRTAWYHPWTKCTDSKWNISKTITTMQRNYAIVNKLSFPMNAKLFSIQKSIQVSHYTDKTKGKNYMMQK